MSFVYFNFHIRTNFGKVKFLVRLRRKYALLDSTPITLIQEQSNFYQQIQIAGIIFSSKLILSTSIAYIKCFGGCTAIKLHFQSTKSIFTFCWLFSAWIANSLTNVAVLFCRRCMWCMCSISFIQEYQTFYHSIWFETTHFTVIALWNAFEIEPFLISSCAYHYYKPPYTFPSHWSCMWNEKCHFLRKQQLSPKSSSTTINTLIFFFPLLPHLYIILTLQRPIASTSFPFTRLVLFHTNTLTH